METQKTVATVVGAVLTIVGIWGFFSSPVLGIFTLNGWHSLIYLVLGLLGLYFGLMAADSAQDYNKWAGVLVLLVAILGFFWVGLQSLLLINTADSWLQLVVGLVMTGVGFFASN